MSPNCACSPADGAVAWPSEPYMGIMGYFGSVSKFCRPSAGRSRHRVFRRPRHERRLHGCGQGGFPTPTPPTRSATNRLRRHSETALDTRRKGRLFDCPGSRAKARRAAVRAFTSHRRVPYFKTTDRTAVTGTMLVRAKRKTASTSGETAGPRATTSSASTARAARTRRCRSISWSTSVHRRARRTQEMRST